MDNQTFESLLAKAGLNQAQLADEAGVDKGTVTRWKKSQEYPKWVEGWLRGRIAQSKLDNLTSALDELKE